HEGHKRRLEGIARIDHDRVLRLEEVILPAAFLGERATKVKRDATLLARARIDAPEERELEIGLGKLELGRRRIRGDPSAPESRVDEDVLVDEVRDPHAFPPGISPRKRYVPCDVHDALDSRMGGADQDDVAVAEREVRGRNVFAL